VAVLDVDFFFFPPLLRRPVPPLSAIEGGIESP